MVYFLFLFLFFALLFTYIFHLALIKKKHKLELKLSHFKEKKTKRSLLVHTKSESDLRNDILLARDIQKVFLKSQAPKIEGLDVNFQYYPAREVLGDFYDFVQLDDENYLIILGDASGKGISATLLTIIFHCHLYSFCKTFSSLEDLLEKLNEAVFKDTENSKYLTMNFCLYNTRREFIKIANAGHNEAMLKTLDGTIRSIKPQGTALGLIPNEVLQPYESIALKLNRGEELFFFTDGVNEALGDNDEEFGLDRIKKLWMKKEDSKDFLNILNEELKDFVKDGYSFDDRTVLTLKKS